MRNGLALCAAALFACVGALLAAPASAAVYAQNDAGFQAFHSAPASSWGAADVEAALEGATWVSPQLSLIGDGECSASMTSLNGCTTYDFGGGVSHKGGVSNFTGNVFTVHFGDQFIVLLFDAPANLFQIGGTKRSVGNDYALASSDIPLPGALWLMGAGIAGLAFALSVRRRGRF